MNSAETGHGGADRAAPAPLAVTAARLSALDTYTGFDVGIGDGIGWVDLASAERTGYLDSWLAELFYIRAGL